MMCCMMPLNAAHGEVRRVDPSCFVWYSCAWHHRTEARTDGSSEAEAKGCSVRHGDADQRALDGPD